MVEKKIGDWESVERGEAAEPEAPEPARADWPLWGAKRIANTAGVSPQTVRRSWAKDPEIPVRRIRGRLFAWRGELIHWLRVAS